MENIHRKYLSMFNWCCLMLVMVAFVQITNCQQCLLESPIKNSCYIKLLQQSNIQNLEPQIAQHLCIILSENLNKIQTLRGDDELNKIAAICSKGQQANDQIGYYTLKLLFMKNNLIDMLMKQYDAFFKLPFEHEKKMKEILLMKAENSENLDSQENISTIDKEFEKAINKTYHQDYTEALNSVQKYIKTIQQAEQKDTKKLIYAQYLKFRCLEKLGRFNEALEMLKQTLKSEIYENDFYLHHLLGNFLMHHLKFQQAISYFTKSISLRSTPFLFSYYNIGLCLEKAGRNQESISVFKKVIDNLNIPNQQPYNALGLAYYLTGSEDGNTKSKIYMKQAQKAYIKSLQINENYTIALYNMGALKLYQKKNNEAIYFFKKAMKIDPDFKSARYGKIKALYDEKDKENQLFKNEIESFLDSIRSQKVTAEIYSEIASIIKEKTSLEGKWKQLALNCVEKGIKIAQTEELLSLKAQILYYQQNYQQSEKNYLKAISLGGRKAHIYFNCGMAQFYQRKYELAIMSFNLAQKIEYRQQTKQMIDLAEKEFQALEL